MFQMIFGFNISQIVRAAALYSLPEHLGQGLTTPEQIAEAESINVEATFRLMRACASIGLLTYDGKSGFMATPLLNTLHKDAPRSLRDTALIQPAPVHWLPWGRFNDAVKTGEPQAMATLGCSAWEYLAKTPVEAASVTGSLRNAALAFNREAATLVNTEGTRVVVDVGGASGTFVHALMQQNPLLEGIVFDLPHVVPTAIDAARNFGLEDRFSVVAGDFFSTPIPSGDLLLLKVVLHDWDDESCLKILRNCRRALHPGGRILLAEMLIDEIGKPGFSALMDLTMLVVLGGKERNLEEFRNLLCTAGFEFASVTKTGTPFVLIEATAI
jgi:SAM-dependent methyltransferase